MVNSNKGMILGIILKEEKIKLIKHSNNGNNNDSSSNSGGGCIWQAYC